MTQDEIIKLAREAGISSVWVEASTRQLERFAALVAANERNRHAWTQEHWTQYEHAIAAAEREACAKVCEENAKEWVDGNNDWCSGQVTGSNDCAAAIRARGKHG